MKMIKIRFWHTENKKMYGPYALPEIANDLGDLTKTILDTYSIPMLWSGEVDRDGLEIYEGDIIKVGMGRMEDEEDSENITYERIEISEVRLGDGAFTVDADFGDYSCTALGWADQMGENDLIKIGNVFENPELLTL